MNNKNKELYSISFYSSRTDEHYEHYIVTDDLLKVLQTIERNNILTFDSFTVRKISSEVVVMVGE